MKKTALILTLTTLMILTCCALGESEYRLLRVDCSGSDVLAMKERLYDLGYYTTAKLTDQYTEAVSKVVAAFQEKNALPVTGEADPYAQAVLYSDAAVRANGNPVKTDAALPAPGAGGDGRFRPLKEGDNGDDVLAIKKILLKLKLYSNSGFNDRFNAAMTQRIKQYQKKEGLPEDGQLTRELQQRLFEAYPTPTPRPTATPSPTPSPTPTPVPRDAEGYLLDPDAAPVVYESYPEGHWSYVSAELQIDITRHQDKKAVLIWYETDIRCKEGVTFDALLTDAGSVEGHTFQDPMTLADRAKAVLAFTDDNFGYRWYRRTRDKVLKYQQGAVVRRGIVRSNDKPDGTYYDFPPLDVLAYYPDGRMEFYYPEEYTGQELLDMGVLHSLAFGPILLENGEINQRIYDSSKYVYTEYNVPEPRQAIGYYEPGHYMLLTVKGRADDSKGVTVDWLAHKLQELGVPSAFNLDGGYTTTLYFMGQAVNKKENVNRAALREVSSMMSIGVRE